ncbi:T9SS type A sorting domain-containing protein [Taibaiella soli]|uniref:Secretion system C-terminal sorting domain-containing protein n=1 Tax=Taibaiella soli TaxID=1649169 RepID=A0A2W2A809_9BACT|nr:T9SS type A sorting domain-containing protein [Taibaiella soli]PZF71495.1 hypothetical protein DN068_18180 [Taibaiella soli]
MKGNKHSLLFFVGLSTAFFSSSFSARAQTDAIYINGPYYTASGSNEQWYGDASLGANAQLYIQDTGKINFYGTNFQATNGARIYGADNIWTTLVQGAGNGSIVFVQPNPNDNSTVQQTLDGGNGGNPANNTQNTFTAIEINNASGVKLMNTDTRIGSNMTFTNGHVYTDIQNTVLSDNAAVTGYNETKYVVTASDGHLVKENYSGAFTFPVGQGDNDYTPAIVTPATANTIHVNVATYANSAPLESNPDGVQRTWNIYGNTTDGALISLQHNSITNEVQFLTNANFVTQYGNPPNHTGDQNSAGPWQSNTPSASTPGTVAGSEVNSRNYPALATTSAANEAYYSKASNTTDPLPVVLLFFEAKAEGCNASLSWRAGDESDVVMYQVRSSVDGKVFSPVASIPAKNIDGSDYNVKIPQYSPVALYNLSIVQHNGKALYSTTQTVRTNCDANSKQQIVLVPNPAYYTTSVTGLIVGQKIALYDITGRLLKDYKAETTWLILDISNYASGMYSVVVTDNDGTFVQALKLLVKNAY